MLTVEDYGRIRRAERDGMGIRAIARALHHSRRTVRKALAQAQPKPYTRTEDPPAPKLGPFKPLIQEILKADKKAPRKQRHTAAQIFRRLRDEHGYVGGCDQVRRYVARHRQETRETFIPLSHEPGQRLECDFGQIYVDFPAGRRQVAVLLATWSYSYCPFAIALPTERTEAILSGTVEALEFFGCVPREVWWDNPRTVVTAILKGRKRTPHERYAALASHYVFEPQFCMPARGNEKPHVENRVFDLQRRWATPVPQFKDLAELNAYLRACCLKDHHRTVAGQTETIGDRFDRDVASAGRLPAQPFDPCVPKEAKVDKYQTVRFDNNRYSTPRNCAFRAVTVKGYVHHIEIVADGCVVARHDRCYEPGQQVLDPVHYLVTLGRRPAALDHADVYRHWRLPPVFAGMRQKLEERHGAPAGARQYVRVLQLLAEHPVARVQRAIERCQKVEDLHADQIIRQVQRQAEQEAKQPETSDPAPTCCEPAQPDLDDVVSRVQVPLRGLDHFDQFLSQGEPAYV
ncbi:MAG: IS21 family transposase [Planctomycetota bacterium]